MRNVRVLSYALQQPDSADDRVATNTETTLEALDDAENYDPDVVVFPEINLQHLYKDEDLPLEDVARSLDSPEVTRIRERARELGAYVLCPLIERDGAEIYNSATLLGPGGDVVGTYRKVAPTINEIEEGRTPGTELPVWETEFGRIGSLICWDSRYPELGIRYAQKDLDLMLFPTHDTGGSRAPFRIWPKRYGFHVAAVSTEFGQVYGPTGIEGETTDGWGSTAVEFDTGGRAPVSFAEVNTDYEAFATGQNRDVFPTIREEYGESLAFHEQPDAGVVVVESIDDSVSIAEIEREYGVESLYETDELERMFDYEDRTRAHIRDTVEDSPVLPSGFASSMPRVAPTGDD
jgi:hypothetical protein